MCAESQVHELWRRIRAKVDQALGKLGVEQRPELAEPPSPEFGDLGVPVFALASQLRKAPDAIAREVAALIQTDDLVARTGTLKGYVNLFLDTQTLGRELLRCLYAHGDAYAAGGAMPKERWLVEYSSPNTNKPLHLGHIRNNLLGMAISAMAQYHGHDVVKVNLINDRGIHISKTMVAWRRWGEGKTPADRGVKGDHFVGDLYVRFEQELKQEYDAFVRSTGQRVEEEEYFNRNSALGAEAHETLRRWEAGDAETLALWERMNAWVLDGFHETYRRMGCSFDLIQRESETYKLGKELVAEGLLKGLFVRTDDGAVTLPLERVGLDGEKVLLRADGTSVYMTQDIGTAVARIDTFQPQRLLYVVGDEQLHHFNVLFRILSLLRPGVGERCTHVSYGMVRLPEGRMKSREGKVVDADDLMEELHALAREELAGRTSDGRAHAEGLTPEETEHRAERIAQAALKFFVYRFTPKKSFEYDPKKSIDFNGQTGPYCLYCYARTRSLLRKAGGPPGFDPALVAHYTLPSEKEILRRLFAYPLVVQRSAAACDPSKVAEWVFGLSSSFARMFTDREGYPILTHPDPHVRQARLMLANCVGTAVRSGLSLLGIDVLEEM